MQKIKILAVVIVAFIVIALFVKQFMPTNPDQSALTGSNLSQKQSMKQTLTYDSIKEQLASGEAYLYDVRTPAEFAEQHVLEAVNLPLDQIETSPPNVAKDALIYVYCRSGNRSGQALQILQQLGYDNVKNLGGLAEMRELGAIFSTK